MSVCVSHVPLNGRRPFVLMYSKRRNISQPFIVLVQASAPEGSKRYNRGRSRLLFLLNRFKSNGTEKPTALHWLSLPPLPPPRLRRRRRGRLHIPREIKHISRRQYAPTTAPESIESLEQCPVVRILASGLPTSKYKE